MNTKLTSVSGHLDIFAHISEPVKKQIFGLLQTSKTKNKKFLWKQGDEANYLVILLEGKVLSYYESEAGRSGATGVWSAGDAVGLGDFGNHHVRQHSPYCFEDATYLVLPFDMLADLSQKVPELSVALLKALLTRLRWFAQFSASLETESAHQRICSTLIMFADRFGEKTLKGIRFDIALSDEKLAALTGVSRQFLNSELSALTKSGLIERTGKSFFITNLPRFSTYMTQKVSSS